MEHFKSRRMRSISWSASHVLDQGELGFETDTDRCKMGDGITAWPSLPYMDENAPPPTATPDRIAYGTTRLCGANLKVTAGFPSITSRMAPQLLYKWSNYSQCLWDIHEVGGTGRWTGQRFATAAALFTFLNANVAKSGDNSLYNVMGSWYDEVDPSIPKIDKIYGMNQFYSALKGRRMSKKSIRCLNRDHLLGNFCRWNGFDAFFAALCNQQIGLPTGALWSAGRERTIWFSRSRFPYGIPHSAHEMLGASMGGLLQPKRWVYDSITTTWQEDLSVSAGYRFVFAPPVGEKSFLWVSFDVVAGTYTFESTHSGILGHLYEPSKSVAVFLRYRNLSTGAAGILCRPIGIDRLGFNWYDATKYDLYSYSDRFDYSPTIRLVGASHLESEASDFRWFRKNAWFPYDSKQQARASWSETKQEQPRVRFFLRDKITQKISSLSHMCVEGQMFRRLAPIKWLVQKA